MARGLGKGLLVVPLTSDGVVKHRHTGGALKFGLHLHTNVQMSHAPFGFYRSDTKSSTGAEQTIHHLSLIHI